VSSWLIPSLGLPVAMTTGRLVVLMLTGVSGHAIGAATAATGAAVMLLLLTVGCAALVGLRRRRASRRGSAS
jgi:Ca2+/Na+ antiporter